MTMPASVISRPASEPTLHLRTKIDYALGNTALAEGDIPGAIRSYDDCVASTARGAALDAVRRDAAINRSFALEQPQSLSAPEDNSSGDRSKSQKAGPEKRLENAKATAMVKSPEGEPESDPGNAGATARTTQATIATVPPRAGAGWGGRAADGLPRRENEETRRTTGSTPRSSTSGPPRTSVFPTKSPRYPPTTTVRIGK